MATAPIDSPIGTIEPGKVAGQRFHWEAVIDDEVVVRIGVHWLMGEENLDPPWTFGSQGERFEVEVKGNPDTFVVVKGWQPETIEEGLVSNPGIVATAAHCVNSVPYVCAAPPGIVTSLELPLVPAAPTPICCAPGPLSGDRACRRQSNLRCSATCLLRAVSSTARCTPTARPSRS